jgi:hypothetical protein
VSGGTRVAGWNDEDAGDTYVDDRAPGFGLPQFTDSSQVPPVSRQIFYQLNKAATSHVTTVRYV